MGSFRLASEHFASSRKFQFHQDGTGDSEEIVISFKQDGIYPPRNFATLGPSELQPPFTLGSVQSLSLIPLTLEHRADLRPHTLCFHTLRSPVFLLNSRFSRFRDAKKIPFRSFSRLTIFRSYGAILQSSFDTVFLLVLAFDAIPPVLD